MMRDTTPTIPKHFEQLVLCCTFRLILSVDATINNRECVYVLEPIYVLHNYKIDTHACMPTYCTMVHLYS